MSAISTTGARIDRWVNGLLVRRYHARLIEALKLERSSRCLCWGAFITCINKPHDEVPDLSLAPYSPLMLAIVMRACRSARRTQAAAMIVDVFKPRVPTAILTS